MNSRIFLLLFAAFAGGLQSQTAPKPKLVVGIVVDQFRYDYLTRFRADYHGGFDRFLTKGADFTNARYAHAPTVTAVGHSIFMSGAMPAVSGIVGNSWYDREEGKVVTSVCDWTVETVGGPPKSQPGAKCTDNDPASPRRLLVSTLGDELRNAHEDSKVIGISIKARASIMPSGHRANAAFWFNDGTGNFVTSTFYRNDLPVWAAQFNERKLPAEYVKRKWDGFPEWNFESVPGAEPYAKLPASPWGNELIERFAEEAIVGEKLGQRNVTDLLTVSFSSNDYVGHAVGPDAPEVRDMAIRTDELLDKLFLLIDRQVGLANTIIVLSADHGVSPVPSVSEGRKMPGGYLYVDLEDTVQAALTRRLGKAEWLIPGAGDTSVYFNYKTLAEFKLPDGKHVDLAQVYRVAREAILSTPQLHAARVYTREQLDNGIAGDSIASDMINGYFPRRSGDLTVVYDPYYLPGSTSGTTHYSPHGYDRHVPVLFLGWGVKPGRYDEAVAPNDIAPTLATMLDIETPSGSSGRVLTEMLKPGL